MGALLEVGTGFHPELTGRENVFVNGPHPGHVAARDRDAVRRDRRFRRRGGFLDTPLKRYSSGMELRLAFAVAAHVQPPILAVDEVLAVGDAEFREKCLGPCRSCGVAGRTVVFVSHDLAAMAQLCTRTIWLEEGKVVRDGPTTEVLAAYLEANISQTLAVNLAPRGGGPVDVLSLELVDERGSRLQTARRDRPFGVRMRFRLKSALSQLDLAFWLVNRRGVRTIDESYSDTGNPALATEPGVYEVRMQVPPALASEDYNLGVWFGAGNDTYFHEEVMAFRLWPGPEDPGDWEHRARAAQPGVSWTVAQLQEADAPELSS